MNLTTTNAALDYRALTPSERRNEYRRQVRLQAIKAYGGKCACCGEWRQEFLTIDHINNDGAAERRLLKKGAGVFFMAYLRRLGWPKDKYQLLCHNCNCAKGFYGACPHRAETKLTALRYRRWARDQATRRTS